MLFSANIGLLYTDIPFCDRIEAAARDGFDGVECHWPYDIPTGQVREILDRLDMPMLGLNTSPGDRASGAFGLAAIPEMRAEARQAIRQGVGYGAAIGARNLHIMAGYSDRGQASEDVFRENLSFACDQATVSGMSVIIEPLNPMDHPGYHLSTLEHAADIIANLNRPNLKMMFDCYHIGRSQADMFTGLKSFLPLIGHIQIAAVPDRSEPDDGEVDVLSLLRAFQKLGYDGWVGAEYRPRTGRTEDGLSWLPVFRRSLEAQYSHDQ
jgi:hydroxypyruvate isomerase